MNSLKCLYIHDHVFKTDGQYYYSEGKITDQVFCRYVKKSDDIFVLSRLEQKDSNQNLTKITLQNVYFEPVDGVSFVRIFSNKLLKNFSHTCGMVKKSDFIVVRLPSFLGVFTLFINLLLNKKYFVEMVGDPKEALLMAQNNKNFIYMLFVNLFSFMNAFFVKRARGVIYVTKTDLQEKYPTKNMISYASNVELNIEEISFSESDFLQKNNTFFVGLIGSFNNEYKGIDTAIYAIKELLSQGLNVQLRILGSGALKEKYMTLASSLDVQNQVYFDGSLANGQAVNQWLDQLDLYIQPSKTEGLPRALIEAMGRGLPAIASSVGGIPELLEQQYLFEKDNVEQFVEKLKALIQSDRARYEAGMKNYNKAREYDSKVLMIRRNEFWTAARKIVEENR